jgi:phytoene desaturase
MSKKAVVIGAGFAGLSASAYLAQAGYKVTVLEKNDQPGGRAMSFQEKGFHFDMGPSWYMMPDIFEEFFSDFGAKRKDFYNLVRLSPSYKVYGSNYVHDIYSAQDKGLKIFDELEPGSSKKIAEFLSKTAQEYDFIRQNILTNPYSKKTSALDKNTLSLIYKIELINSYHARIKKVSSNPEIQKILEFMVVFMGGSPENIPGAYSLLTHVDFNLGIWYPMGGFKSVVVAMEKLAKTQGATFVYDAEVTSIDVGNKLAHSVTTKAATYEADLIISTIDYQFSETKLLTKQNQSYSHTYWQRKTLSPSGLLLFLGVNQKVQGLQHHTLFFDTDWHKHFSQVFKDHTYSPRPLFYVGTPSKTDATVAPKNSENIFVLAPLSNNLHPTKSQAEELTDSLISRIEARTGSDFSKNITVKKTLGEQYFKDAFNAYKGNAFGLAHTLRQTAFFRPSIKSKKVKNLYYAGQYTNPGTGVPMVILSGKVAASLALSEVSNG